MEDLNFFKQVYKFHNIKKFSDDPIEKENLSHHTYKSKFGI